MPHKIDNDLHIISTKSSFLVNLLGANNDLIQQQLYRIHPKECFLDNCSIKTFTINYKKCLQSFVFRLNNLFDDFEKISNEYKLDVSEYSPIRQEPLNSSRQNGHVEKRELVGILKISESEKSSITNESDMPGCSISVLTDQDIFGDAIEPVLSDNQKKKTDTVEPLNTTKIFSIEEMKTSASFLQIDSYKLNDTFNLDTTLVHSNDTDSVSKESPTKTLKRCSAMIPSLSVQDLGKETDYENKIEKKEIDDFDVNQLNKSDEIKEKESNEYLPKKDKEFARDLIDITDSHNSNLVDSNISLKNLIADINNNCELSREKMPPLIRPDSSVHGSGMVSTSTDERLSSKIHKQINLTDGMTYKCWVTHAKDPLLFWIQIQDTQKINSTLEKNMNKFYADKDNDEKFKIKSIHENAYCAALYMSKWYRVKILSINKQANMAEVHYIDYGNDETVKIDELRSLVGEFMCEKKLAVPLSLANAYPKAGLNESIIKSFSNLVLNRAAEITVKSNSKWPIFFCKLNVFFKENGKKLQIDALKYLIEENLVVKQKNDIIISEFIDKIEQENKHFDLNNQFISASQHESSVSDFVRTNYQTDVNANLLDLSENIDPYESFAQNGIHFKDYTSNFKELSQNFINLDENSNFKFKTVKIVDPFEFYIRTNDDETRDLYLVMEKELNAFYAEIEIKLAFHSKKLNFIKPDGLCVVRHSVNNQFYRAIILSNTDNILVNFFDHGVTCSVDSSRVLPFSREFLYLPPHCIKCKLMSIKLTQSTSWSKEAIDIFNKLGGTSDMIYEGKVSSKNKSIKCSLIESVDMLFFGENQINISIELVRLRLAFVSLPKYKNIDPLDQLDSVSLIKSGARPKDSISSNAKLPYNVLPTEDEEFRKNRISEYVDYQAKYTKDLEPDMDFQASLCETEEKSNSKTLLKDLNTKSETVDKPGIQMADEEKAAIQESNSLPVKDANKDVLDDWNPAKEHFDSMRNTYGFNEASYEAHAYGYETRYKENLCSNFKNTGECKKPRCPFLHTELKEEVVSTSKPCFSVYIQPHKFIEGDMLLLDIVAIDLTFYATVLGYIEKSTDQMVMCNNLKKLNFEMSKYYGNKKFLAEKSTFFVVGQIVAVRSKRSKHPNNSWFRARVCKIKHSDNIDKSKLIVFFIDYGFKEKVLISDVYPIKKTFLNYQEHSIQFQLADVKFHDGNALRDFSRLVNLGNDLKIALVKTSSSPLQVYLYDGNKDCSINELLIKQGHAK